MNNKKSKYVICILVILCIIGVFLIFKNIITQDNNKSSKVDTNSEIKLNQEIISLEYGKSSQIVATIKSNNETDKTLEWTSSDPSLVTVDNNGNITVVGNKDGIATITVKTKDGKHSAIAIISTIQVKNDNENTEGIKLDVEEITLEYNATSKLTAMSIINDADTANYEWTSSDPSLVTVDNNGNITVVGNKDGIVTITVKTKDGKYSASAKIKTTKVITEIKVKEIKLDKNSISLDYGKSSRITATIIPSDATNKNLEWISSDTSLVTVDNNGNIKAVGNKDGIATITARSVDGDCSASTQVKVIGIKPTGIKLDKSSVTLQYGKTTKLTATISPSNAANKDVIWTSSNPKLVVVDRNGNIGAIANSNGTATITAKTSNGKYSASAKVSVTKVETTIKVSGVKLDKSSVTLQYGKTTKLTATISPSNATNKNVTWTSSDTSLVTVDSTGNIKAVGNKNGTATITAKTIDGSYTAKSTVQVTAIRVSGVKLDKSSVTLQYGKTSKLTATVSPSNAADKNVTWTSSDTSLVTVDSTGNIKAVGNKNGTATITAKTKDGSYMAKSIVKVTAKTIRVSGVKLDKSSVTLQYGKTSKLTATVSPSDAIDKNVTWTSSDTSLVTIDSKGNIKAVGNKSGTVTITVKTKDGSYIAKSTIKVTAKTIRVSGVKLDKSSVTLQYGKTSKLTATVSPSNATDKKVTWTSSDTSLVKVNSAGNITVIGNKNGTATITVKTKDGSYIAKSTIKVTALKVDVSGLTNCSSKVSTSFYANKEFPNKTAKLNSCIKNIILAKTNVRMQNFSITSNYLYITAPFNGGWLMKNGKPRHTEQEYLNQYNEILYGSDFEKISSTFITRIGRKNGDSQINEIKYAGHGQGFDAISGKTDALYLAAIASPNYSKTLGVGAFSNGISYTSFKENGKIRVPGLTVAFNSNATIKRKILASSYTENNKFNSTKYYNAIKSYSKNGSLGILSMATDGTNLVYSMRTKVGSSTKINAYIHKVSDIKNENTKAKPIIIENVTDGQGFEINGNYLYVIKDLIKKNDDNHYIEIIQYSIKPAKKIRTLEINISAMAMYKNRESIEAEGISIYNNKIYIGIASKDKDKSIKYNDIHLLS